MERRRRGRRQCRDLPTTSGLPRAGRGAGLASGRDPAHDAKAKGNQQSVAVSAQIQAAIRREDLGKALPADQFIGESWELYDFPPGVVNGSVDWVSAPVANGKLAGRTLHSLVTEYGADLYGQVPLVQPAGQFPILIKYLDAREVLSVQVHPDEPYVRTHPGAHLKTEAWYIVQSDPGARIHKGVKPSTTLERFREAVHSRTVANLINEIPVKAGQCHYLPSGTVHALGAGILAAEVQTPSDTTFRVYDFDRVDPSNGKTRDLHIDEAMDCIDFTASEPQPAARSHVASAFTTDGKER
jgi:mannose-6-phosphate isomerase